MPKNSIICTLIILISITALLFGCTAMDPEQRRLAEMCDCMEKVEKETNTQLARELLGNETVSALANASALGCAQQVMESEKLSYSEMVYLYQSFMQTACGRRFGVDAASVEKMEKDAQRKLDRVLGRGEAEVSSSVDEDESSGEDETKSFYSDTSSAATGIDTSFNQHSSDTTLTTLK